MMQRLTEYEVWTRVHGRPRARALAELGEQLPDRLHR
jgi:hypothetical protein